MGLNDWPYKFWRHQQHNPEETIWRLYSVINIIPDERPDKRFVSYRFQNRVNSFIEQQTHSKTCQLNASWPRDHMASEEFRLTNKNSASHDLTYRIWRHMIFVSIGPTVSDDQHFRRHIESRIIWVSLSDISKHNWARDLVIMSNPDNGDRIRDIRPDPNLNRKPEPVVLLLISGLCLFVHRIFLAGNVSSTSPSCISYAINRLWSGHDQVML